MCNLKKSGTISLIGLLILSWSVFAIPPTITRDLPLSAAPASTFTVTLVMDVDEGDVPVICGIKENYPPGWTASDISLGGSDKGDRIEWLFWQMGNPVIDQNITYKITVPGGASGTATFSGTADISIVDPYAIVGDTEVIITETTTTTTIPSYSVYVTRDLPLSAAPASTFTVTLVMDVDEGDVPGTCGITENYPPGWTVSDISLGGSDTGSRIEWLFLEIGNPVVDQNITYTVTVPNNASGTATFSGTVDIGTVDPYAIVGDTVVTITETTTTTTVSGTTTTSTTTSTTTTVSGTTTSTTTTIDPCDGVTCDPYCSGDIRIYDGECRDGICVYGSDELCTYGCSNGECNTPTTTTITTTTISGTTTTTTTIPWTTTTSTTVPVTTTTTPTTTTIWPCELPGDYPTCWEVILEEVVDFILLWSQGQVALEDVINLINAWAEGTICELPGNYSPCGEVTLEEVVDFVFLWSQDLATLEDVINLINAWAAS